MDQSDKDDVASIERLSAQEAANRLGINVSTLFRWRREGIGPAYEKFGGRVCYRADVIAEYKANGEAAA